MRLHYLQHEEFEAPGSILSWAAARNHSVSSTMVFNGEPLPSHADFDLLVMMGGYMSVYEEERLPWLVSEKQLVREAIAAGKAVLGVCLGAQMIASALGAEVRRHTVKEIGWFPVTLTEEGCASPLLAGWPKTFQAFHWHGDMLEVPVGAVKLAFSEACPNQAFLYGKRALALQFHIETTEASMNRLVSTCSSDLVPPQRYVQSADTILQQTESLPLLPKLLYPVLDRLEKQ